MDSLFSFPVGSFIPYNMPVYPGALRFPDETEVGFVLHRLRYGFRAASTASISDVTRCGISFSGMRAISAKLIPWASQSPMTSHPT